MITPKRPAGFNEFLPTDQMAFNAMISVIRLVYEQHGYNPIETPALELAPVLLAKEGGETAKQVYRFKKGDNDLALRFDLTIPLARYVAEHYYELAFPFRRYQIQESWRAEKPQAGRYRQFYQCDIDIIGSASPMADVDVLLTARDALRELGLKDVVFKISHRGLLTGFLKTKKLEKYCVGVLRAIDKLDKQGEKVVTEELSKIGLKKSDAKELLKFAKIVGPAATVLKKLTALKIKQNDFEKALSDLTMITTSLAAAGVKAKEYCLDLHITRGFDYYTGAVFETMLTKHKDVGSICAGGRFDNLLSQYHKEQLPGVGISIGLSRLFTAIKGDFKSLPSSPAQALIIPLSSDMSAYALQVDHVLRRGGLNVFVYPGFDKAGKQLKYADKLGIPLVALVGETEEKKQTVTIKNMQTGKQVEIKLTKAAGYIKKNL